MLPGGPRRRDLRLLAGRRCRTPRRTTSGTGFIVSDGTDTDYYADDTAALDGGLGAAERRRRRPELGADGLRARLHGARPGRSDAVIYQIFPDRFRNGRKDNDPKTGDVRYDDPVLKLALGRHARGLLPELCRRRHELPVALRPDTARLTARPRSSPRGRDYFGGDLKGVDQQLDYLDALGVTAIYFNPIFDAGSNHCYDTQDYTQDRPVLRHAEGLGQPRQAREGARDPGDPRRRVQPHVVRQPAVRPLPPLPDDRGVRVDRPPYRAWFVFHDVAPGRATAPCRPAASARLRRLVRLRLDPRPAEVEPGGPGVLPDRARTAIAKRWLKAGAAAGGSTSPATPSFPNGYWESFRGGRRRRPTRRADDQRDLAEGLDAAPDAPRRPARHDDELPAPRRGPRAARPGSRSTRRASPTAATDHAVSQFAAPARLDSRGLPRRGLLLADEPPRQPRHRAAPLDAHAGRRDDRRPRERTPPTSRRASCACGSPR